MTHSISKSEHFYRLLTIAVGFLILALTSCAGRTLKTQEASFGEATGNFTLLLFGCKYPDDIMNVAFLDKEEDPYTMEIYAPGFQYKTENNVPAADAFGRADQFIHCNVNYQQTQVRKILDPQGNVAGYEVRPLYAPYRYGMLDVMLINYTLKDDKIVVYIRLDPTVEEEIEHRGGKKDRNGR